jgi:transcriptional regulator with XRE-family HTH domain
MREKRLAAGISLRELARRLNVSASLLSQVERGLAQPSVSTLWALVCELGLSLDALFAPSVERDDRTEAVVVRADERRVIDLDGGVRWEQLTPARDPQVDFAFVTYEPHDGSVPEQASAIHPGREYGYLLSGRLSIDIASHTYELSPGDSIVFESDRPHRFRAVGEAPARAVWWNLGR